MTPTRPPAKPANLPAAPTPLVGKADRSVHPSAGGAPVQPAEASQSKTEWVRIQAYATPEQNARVRNAWAAEMDPDIYPNLSRWILAAVMEKVERTENEKNNGQPFPAPAGGVPKSPRGRPTNS